jgi:hypothetical protein
MGNIDLDQLDTFRLVMLFNVTTNHPNFTQAFNGKIKNILNNLSA